jgi:very-short-patch-repair endonuclease
VRGLSGKKLLASRQTDGPRQIVIMPRHFPKKSFASKKIRRRRFQRGGRKASRYTLYEKLAFAEDMRQHPTGAEAALWEMVRANQLGHRFRRQITVYGYIVDFYCPALRLAIEVDGSIHTKEFVARNDEIRENALTACGILVLRFDNADVLNFPSVVCARIQTECDNRSLEKRALNGVWFIPRPRRVKPATHPALSVVVCGSLQNETNSLPQNVLPKTDRVASKAEIDAAFRKIRQMTVDKRMEIPKQPITERAQNARNQLAEYQRRKQKQA